MKGNLILFANGANFVYEKLEYLSRWFLRKKLVGGKVENFSRCGTNFRLFLCDQHNRHLLCQMSDRQRLSWLRAPGRAVQ
jgi:hypothetical protein